MRSILTTSLLAAVVSLPLAAQSATSRPVGGTPWPISIST